MEQFAAEQPKNVEEFIDENEPWLLIGIPNRDPFLVTQYLDRHSVSSDQHMKKLMSLREGLHVMMQCHVRLVGKPKAAVRFRRQGHVDEITVFVGRDFIGMSVFYPTRKFGQIGTDPTFQVLQAPRGVQNRDNFLHNDF